MADNTCKYYKLVKQVSYNSGQTWSNVDPPQYQQGDLYESGSTDCSSGDTGSTMYRWVSSGTTCVGNDKWERSIKQYSNDSGATWQNVTPRVYSATTLIERDSEDCSSTPPSSLLYKYWGYEDDPSSAETIGYNSGKMIESSSSVLGNNLTLFTGSRNYHKYGYVGNHIAHLDWNELNIPSQVLRYVYLDIPDSVVSIKNFFRSTSINSGTSFTTLDLPNTLLHFEKFGYDNMISSITLPETLITAPSFETCPNLTSVIIPKNVSIVPPRLLNNNNLQSLYFKGKIPPLISSGGKAQDSYFTIYVPTESIDLYRQAFSGHVAQNRIEGGVSTDDSYSDNYKFKVTYTDNSQQTFPIDNAVADFMAIIDKNGFEQPVSSITSIDFSDTVKYVSLPHYNYSNLRNINFGSNLKSINSVSDLNTKITTLNYNDGLLELRDGDGAAYSVPITYPSSVSLPSSLIYIGRHAFHYSNDLTSIVIPRNVKHIFNQAFTDCTSLTSISIPSNVISIGGNAFQNCYEMTSITIENGLKHIGSRAFKGCSSLESVIIPNSVEFIGDESFMNCEVITSCSIGNGIKEIGGAAFRYCSGLASITINAMTPPTLLGANTFNETNNCPIYVPSASLETYKTAWSGYASRIQPIP